MFEKKSRYKSKDVETYEVTDRRGRTVTVVSTPGAPVEKPLGIHLLKQGQRPDHLAVKYLDDPAGYWRICELNDVMLPETLTEAREIIIPRKRR